MDARVLYWTGALLDLLLVALFAVNGVRQINRGDVKRHRGSMGVAAALVLAFLVSYVFKLAIFGREDLASWASRDVWVLRVHETCVAAMLLGGTLAGSLGFRMRHSRSVTRDPEDPMAPQSLRRWHRRAGWTAVVGAISGFVTAGWVLVGMYLRV